MIQIGSTDEVIKSYSDDINSKFIKNEDTSNFNREGSGEVRFTSVEVSSIENENEINHGDSLVVETDFICKEKCEFVRFRIGLVDEETKVIIAIANIDASNLKEGGKIRCIFPQIALLPRIYSVYLSATDLLLLYDRWAPAKLFTISGAPDEEIKYSVGDGELMRLPHEIELIRNL